MNGVLVRAVLMLTVIMFASGYVVTFVTSMFAIALNLPGPYSQEKVAWLWLALHVVMLFGTSFLFCRWLARKVERSTVSDRTMD